MIARKIGLGRTDWCKSRALTRRNYRALLPAATSVRFRAPRSPDGEPTLGVAVDGRTARRPRRCHAVAYHRHPDAAELRGPTGHPAMPSSAHHPGSQPGQRRHRLDLNAGDVAVKKHRIIDDGLTAQHVLLTGGSPER